MEVRYDIVLENELKVTRVVEDMDDIWYMWMNGCFSGKELSESAKRDFIELIYDEESIKMEYLDDLDFELIQITNMKVRIGRW